jgi:hypothetical protein
MDDLQQRLARLSPGQRDLLIQQLLRPRQSAVRTRTAGDRQYFPVKPVLARSLAARRDWDGATSFNVTGLYEARERLDAALVAAVVERLVAHHDALRLRIARLPDGYYHHIASPDEPVSFSVIDLRHVAAHDLLTKCTQIAHQLGSSLNFLRGPLIHVVLLELGSERRQKLLIVASHIVMDGFSWSILMNDFVTAYLQLKEGRAIDLPETTTSIRDFIETRARYARSEEFRRLLAEWKSLPWNTATSLPTDRPGGQALNTSGSIERFYTTTTRELTSRLLRGLRRSGGFECVDVLVAALAMALQEWTGGRTFSFVVANNGRASAFPGEDLSRTLAATVSFIPALIHLAASGGARACLESVRRDMRRSAPLGTMWPWVDEHKAVEPAIGLNFTSRMTDREAYDALLARAEPISPFVDPAADHWAQITCVGGIRHSQLRLRWEYSENLYRPATVRSVAEDFQRALDTLIQVV